MRSLLAGGPERRSGYRTKTLGHDVRGDSITPHLLLLLFFIISLLSSSAVFRRRWPKKTDKIRSVSNEKGIGATAKDFFFPANKETKK